MATLNLIDQIDLIIDQIGPASTSAMAQSPRKWAASAIIALKDPQQIWNEI